MHVELNGSVAQQKLVVLKCSNSFVPLIGRPWLDCFFSGCRSGFTNTALVNSLNEKKDFSEPIVGYEGELMLIHEQPIFKKAYTVPYKLKDKLAQHLEMLGQQKDDNHGPQESIEAGPFSGSRLDVVTSRIYPKEAWSGGVGGFPRLYGIRGKAIPGVPRGCE